MTYLIYIQRMQSMSNSNDFRQLAKSLIFNLVVVPTVIIVVLVAIYQIVLKFTLD